MSNVYNRQFSANVANYLAQKMMFQAQQDLLWAQWGKFTTPDGKAVDENKGINAKQVTNSPVVFHRELKKKRGDELKVPMLRLLTRKPTYGLNQMKDREDRFNINHAGVFIDIIREAVEHQDGIMMEQTTKDYQLPKQVAPALMRHYAEVANYLLYPFALYNGYSENILESNRQGLPSAVSHPHIFVAGDGKVSYGVSNYPGTSGYEAAVATAFDTLGSSDIMSASLLRGLNAHPEVRYIRPLVMHGGKKYRIIVMHPYQLADLRADAEFKATVQAGYVERLVKDNPLLTGMAEFYEGFAIFDGSQAVFPVSTSSGSPVYGPSGGIVDLTSLRSYASETKFGAYILGDNALLCAKGSNMRFINRVDDYNELQATTYRCVEGVSRGDYKNEEDGVNGDNWIKEGSAIVATYESAPTI